MFRNSNPWSALSGVESFREIAVACFVKGSPFQRPHQALPFNTAIPEGHHPL